MASRDTIKRDFKRVIKNEQLRHGYIFFGENEHATREIAEWLAQYCERGDTKKEQPLIDVRVFGGDELSISIDESRELTSFLWQTPIASAHRTAIIHRADRCTTHAQNALLKIAEEPPQHGLLLLTVNHVERLLNPLVSRFFKIYINDLADEEISDEATKTIKEFLRASTRDRSKLLKDMIEEKQPLDEFVKGMLIHFNKDLKRNMLPAKRLLASWQNMNQFNTNKRLQLEAALLELPKV